MKRFCIDITSSMDLSLSTSVWIEAESKKEAIKKFKKEYDAFDIKCLLKEDFTIENIDDFDCSIAEVIDSNKILNTNFVSTFEDFNYYDD